MDTSFGIELHEHLLLHQNQFKEFPPVCSCPVTQFNAPSVALRFHSVNQITIIVDLKTSKKCIRGGFAFVLVWWVFFHLVLFVFRSSQ